MQFDTTLSLELVVTILAILAAVWRMEGKFDRRLSDLRTELKGDIADLRTDLKTVRTEFKGDIADLRTDLKTVQTELKADNASLRQEFKADISELRTELKADISELHTEIRRVEGKVDAGNQRLARLEGIILAREDMVDTIAESPQ